MYAAIGQRGNTIDKTVDILRKFRAEESGHKQINVHSDSQKDRFRLATLYGAGLKRVKDFRGRRQSKQKGDDRDYTVSNISIDDNVEKAIKKFMEAPLLSEEGLRRLESTVTTSRLSIFELIHQMNVHYRVSLTREEAASLAHSWDCIVGSNSKPQIDYTRVLKHLYHIAEKQKIIMKAKKEAEMKIVKNE